MYALLACRIKKSMHTTHNCKCVSPPSAADKMDIATRWTLNVIPPPLQPISSKLVESPCRQRPQALDFHTAIFVRNFMPFSNGLVESTVLHVQSCSFTTATKVTFISTPHDLESLTMHVLLHFPVSP